MENIIEIKSEDGNSTAKLELGELISYNFNGSEIMHQKGEPGWNRAEIEMFPVVGATKETNHIVKTPKGECVQDQHGLMREMKYDIEESNESNLVFFKKYIANTKIKNSKFPERSTQEELYWPYDFTFKKTITITNEELKIDFEIISEENVPYMLGFHPAFKLSGNGNESFEINGEEISLGDVQETQDNALPKFNVDEIILNREDGIKVTVKTSGFNNVMLWSRVNEMVCIEPMTHYPKKGEEQNYFDNTHNLFTTGNDCFQTIIKPEN